MVVSGGALLGGAGPHVLLPNGLFDYGCPYCKTPHFKREALDLHIRCHVGQVRVCSCVSVREQQNLFTLLSLVKWFLRLIVLLNNGPGVEVPEERPCLLSGEELRVFPMQLHAQVTAGFLEIHPRSHAARTSRARHPGQSGNNIHTHSDAHTEAHARRHMLCEYPELFSLVSRNHVHARAHSHMHTMHTHVSQIPGEFSAFRSVTDTKTNSYTNTSNEHN